MDVPHIASDPKLKDLIATLQTRAGSVHVSGLWGSSAPMLAAWVSTQTGRTVLLVTGHAHEAEEALDDLELFSGRSAGLLPAWEALPGEGAGAAEIQAERLRLCGNLADRGTGSDASPAPLLAASIQALLQPVPSPARLAELTYRIEVGQRLTGSGSESAGGPDGLVSWLVGQGYHRLDLVESPGDFARRGDIVDIFAPGETAPIRVEFLDDEIESIRLFDLSTQRSMKSLHGYSIGGTSEEGSTAQTDRESFLRYLPEGTLVFLDSPGEIEEMGRTLRNRVALPDRLFEVTETLADLQQLDTVYLSRFGGLSTSDEKCFEFDVRSVARFEGKAHDAVQTLCALAGEKQIYVVCDSPGEEQRLASMIEEIAPESRGAIHLREGLMHRGFEWATANTIVVPHHEVFRRHRPVRKLRRTEVARTIDAWTDLKPGELVVHVVHGIGIFRGLKTMRKGETQQQEEYLTIEFADHATIHVPASQLDLVQKYIGAGGGKPQLSKLGGKRWKRTKELVADAVSDLAAMLIRTQALREQAVGVSYPADTEWQREFEAAFPYEETEDQIIVAQEIKDDLIRPRPMDRLLCGDVGYGKTELAMRAAFKVIEYGRQAAVLVPTTVLAEQHYESFCDRLRGYPFEIGCLSRFRLPREQKRIVEAARKGQVDIVIGTHRLLSKDVRFKNLGLVVIDEEQRFGVEHKEKLRSLRETVDVLTLSATPIPRTLHMSMMGIRDISALQTPPVDRRSIATHVRPFSRDLIRDAILREMNRDGQVFFVHNHVRTIFAMADTVRSIVPEARVVVGHGQMAAEELEDVMHRFVHREADVLVATTIIESGIDIPAANTIFINRAERFGLADLHQLRGRVGRSSHRAYCYLLLAPDQTPTSKAAKRLKAIEEFSELGAGFRIAMRDLEIRGAGNLLGKEQSGHIAAVGYEMYCRLMEQTVRRLRNEPELDTTPVHIDLDVAAHIPPQYISSERARIEVYRRLAACRIMDDVAQLEKDLKDTFGAFGRPVQQLLDLAELRVLARHFGIRSMRVQEPDVIFQVKSLADAEPAFRDAPGPVRMPDAETLHLRLGKNYLERPTLIAVLRRMFRRAEDEGRMEN